MTFKLLIQGGFVMLPLCILSVVALMIFFERLFYLHKGSIRLQPFLEGITNLIEKRRILEAITVCQETHGPVAAVVKAVLSRYTEPQSSIILHAQSVALVEIPLLERRLGTLIAIAYTAPFLGLLGTILSFFEAFSHIMSSGAYGTIPGFSGAVAAALISTAFGLAIAFLSYLGYHILFGRIRALIHSMEYAAHHTLQSLIAHPSA